MKKTKKTYPLLAIRISRRQMAYIRRRAKDCGMKWQDYARETLAPSFALNGK